MKGQDLLSAEQTPVADALDEYLLQFRDLDEGLIRPITRRGRAVVPPSHGPRAVLRRVTPSPLRRTYHAARRRTRPTGRGRVLPDFLLIGAAKCGTTSLFDWMCEHPFIVRPMTDGTRRKELL